MTAFSELLLAMPDVFRAITIEQTLPTRLAPWLEAAGSVEACDLEIFRPAHTLYPLPMDEALNCLTPDSQTMHAMVAALDANRHALRLLDDLHTSPYVALPVPLDDVVPISEGDQKLLIDRLPRLLLLQYVDARCLAYVGRHKESLLRVGLMYKTAAKLLASSFHGTANHEGLYQLYNCVNMLAELSGRFRTDEDQLFRSAIAQLQEIHLRAVDFVQTQLLPYCSALTFAVLNCPESQTASVILEYLHNCQCVRSFFSPMFIERDEAGGNLLRLVANALLDGHPSPFDKEATLSRLRDALSAPWIRLEDEPIRLREQLTKTFGDRFFLTGVPEAFATVIVGGRYVRSDGWPAIDRTMTAARERLSTVPNVVGEALLFEARRVFCNHVGVVMDSWYDLRLVAEVARALIGIKAFTMRWSRVPTHMSEVVARVPIGGAPIDPYSRKELEYLPERGIIRIDPSAEEIRQWPVSGTRKFDYVWAVGG